MQRVHSPGTFDYTFFMPDKEVFKDKADKIDRFRGKQIQEGKGIIL